MDKMKNYSMARKFIAIIGGLAYLQSIALVEPSSSGIFWVRLTLALLSLAAIFFDRKVFVSLLAPVFLQFALILMPWDTVGALGAIYLSIRVLFLVSVFAVPQSFAAKKWFWFFLLSLLPMTFGVWCFYLSY